MRAKTQYIDCFELFIGIAYLQNEKFVLLFIYNLTTPYVDIIKSNGAPKEAGDKRPGDLYRYALWKPLDGLGETPVQLSGDYSLRLRYERNLYADEPGSPKKLEVFELTRNGVIISLHGQGSSIRIDGQDVTDDAEVVKLVALFEEKWDECALLLKTTQVEKQRDGIRTKLERFYG